MSVCWIQCRDWARPWCESYHYSSRTKSFRSMSFLPDWQAVQEEQSANEMFPHNDASFYCCKCGSHQRAFSMYPKARKCQSCRRQRAMSRK